MSQEPDFERTEMQTIGTETISVLAPDGSLTRTVAVSLLKSMDGQNLYVGFVGIVPQDKDMPIALPVDLWNAVIQALRDVSEAAGIGYAEAEAVGGVGAGRAH